MFPKELNLFAISGHRIKSEFWLYLKKIESKDFSAWKIFYLFSKNFYKKIIDGKIMNNYHLRRCFLISKRSIISLKEFFFSDLTLYIFFNKEILGKKERFQLNYSRFDLLLFRGNSEKREPIVFWWIYFWPSKREFVRQ